MHHPNKLRKFRIFFDCKAEYNGTSPNKTLLPGPGLSNQLVGVLMRFAEEEVALTSDIGAMFYYVWIPPEQRIFVEFLW